MLSLGRTRRGGHGALDGEVERDEPGEDEDACEGDRASVSLGVGQPSREGFWPGWSPLPPALPHSLVQTGRPAAPWPRSLTLQGVEQGEDVDGGQAQGREDGQSPGHAHQAGEAQQGEGPLAVLPLLLACGGARQSEDLPGHQAQDHDVEEEGDEEVAVDGDVEGRDGSFLLEPAPGAGERPLGLGQGPASARQPPPPDLQ